MKYRVPTKKHEDNLKVELYYLCRRERIKFILEYHCGNSRFDGVIVRKKDIIIIIEVKNYNFDQAQKEFNKPSKQLDKYKEYNIPILVLWSHQGITRIYGGWDISRGRTMRRGVK